MFWIIVGALCFFFFVIPIVLSLLGYLFTNRVFIYFFCWAALFSLIAIVIIVSNNKAGSKKPASVSADVPGQNVDTQMNTNSNASSPEPLTLPVTVLETDNGETDSGTYVYKYPDTTSVPGASPFVGKLGAYGATYSVWLGLAGWTGSGTVYADGSTGVSLYPLSGSSEAGPRISYDSIPVCQSCMLDEAGPYFPNALDTYNQEYSKDGFTPVIIPIGLAVTPISQTLVTYALPDKDGLLTRGVAYYNPNAQSTSPYVDAEFILPVNDSDVANFLEQSFISQQGLK